MVPMLVVIFFFSTMGANGDVLLLLKMRGTRTQLNSSEEIGDACLNYNKALLLDQGLQSISA